jgi:Cd2+/Zn2+-exporting ATPase/Cu+-exporting ATPase
MSTKQETLELRVTGIDCAECAEHLQHSLAKLSGVSSAQVLFTAEKAVLQRDPTVLDMAEVEKIFAAEGCTIAPISVGRRADASARSGRSVLVVLGIVVAGVVLVVIVGEVLGLFDWLTVNVPWPLGWVIVAAGGYPVFRETIRNLLHRRITSSTLMSVGAVAALVSGHWPVALVVVVFMRVSDFVESFTAERGRIAIKSLLSLAPKTARVERDGVASEVAVEELRTGDIVVVRPGEQIPVDGDVVDGYATVDQASITGESMPVEVSEGSRVFASTIAQLGSLRVRTDRVGADSTFGRIVQMVEDAEAHRAQVQRVADRFAAYYLPVVMLIAAATYIFRRDPLATVAVLVVACSCSFALATPIAILASVGAAARKGLLVKGGKYLEALARADVVLLDKTGTLTSGRPRVTDVISLNGIGEDEVIRIAASAERDSEHPLAEAVRQNASERQLAVPVARNFRAVPGQGVAAEVDGWRISVGNQHHTLIDGSVSHVESLESAGRTVLFVERDSELVGIIGAMDTVRPEVPEALQQLRNIGLKHLELLTGDNERVAAALASELGVDFRARLLPEDKIARVKELQAQGHRVVMIGDGVNDAPALAQADVGIAMGAAGSDVALEAAHIALMRDDWSLVPKAFEIARRTMNTVKLNIGFTALYNLVGLSLASMGILPPALAAAAQSLPDFGIVANSSRLLRQS